MGVNDPRTFAAGEGRQPPHAAKVNAAFAPQDFNQEPFPAELFAQRTQFVQTGKHETKLVAQMSRQPRGKHLRPADIEAV